MSVGLSNLTALLLRKKWQCCLWASLLRGLSIPQYLGGGDSCLLVAAGVPNGAPASWAYILQHPHLITLLSCILLWRQLPSILFFFGSFWEDIKFICMETGCDRLRYCASPRKETVGRGNNVLSLRKGGLEGTTFSLVEFR